MNQRGFEKFSKIDEPFDKKFEKELGLYYVEDNKAEDIKNK